MKPISYVLIIWALVTEASTLKCFKCDNPTGNCTQQEVCDPAQNLNCRTISATLTLAGTLTKHYIYGCGICTGNLSFNGGTLTATMTDSCCQSDLCNNQTIPDVANTTLNGLECYVCASPSASTCENPTAMVKCVGMQTRCFHSSVTYNEMLNITIKGCITEKICKNTNIFHIYNIDPKLAFYCCGESGCNRGRTSLERSTTTLATPTNSNPALLQHGALLVLPLLILIGRLV